jgi:uncharacterized protein (DUF1499 family)
MADRPSLSMQLGALKHCVAYAGQQGVSESIIQSAEAGIASFTFLRDHEEAYKALQKVMQTFPGSVVEIVENVSNEEEQQHV